MWRTRFNIPERQIAAGTGERERSHLPELLGRDGSLPDLVTTLCAEIRTGERSLDDPALQNILVSATFDKIAVDQPSSSPYRAPGQKRKRMPPVTVRPATS